MTIGKYKRNVSVRVSVMQTRNQNHNFIIRHVEAHRHGHFLYSVALGENGVK